MADTRDTITLKPERMYAENIGEFYPEAVSAAARVIYEMAHMDTKRDAGVIAACVVSEALHALLDAERRKEPRDV